MCSFRTIARNLRKLKLPRRFFKKFKIPQNHKSGLNSHENFISISQAVYKLSNFEMFKIGHYCIDYFECSDANSSKFFFPENRFPMRKQNRQSVIFRPKQRKNSRLIQPNVSTRMNSYLLIIGRSWTQISGQIRSEPFRIGGMWHVKIGRLHHLKLYLMFFL